jgi:hypothetical protein
MKTKLLIILLLLPPAAFGQNGTAGALPPGGPFLTGYGDSITYGIHDTSGQGGWLGVLAKKLGSVANNQGVGQQTSTQIKDRLVAAGQPVTVGGDSIPSGTTCAVSLTWNNPPDDPAFNVHTVQPSTARAPSPYNNSNGSTVGGMWGTIAGVEGQIVDGSWNASGRKWTFNHTYTFTPRVCPASPVPVPSGSLWKPMLFDWKTSLVFLEGGYNNIQSPGGVARVESDFDQMVAELPGAGNAKRVVLFPVMYSALWQTGSPQAENVAAANTNLQNEYVKYWPIVNGQNLLQYLASLYDRKNPIDVYEQTFNPLVVPSSMRALWTNIGTLTSPITDTSTCSFSLSARTLYEFINVDSESIKILAMNGNDVAGCIRGFGGTKAATHSAGAPYSGEDIVHPNTRGHEAIAAFFYSWVTQNSSYLLGNSAGTRRR